MGLFFNMMKRHFATGGYVILYCGFFVLKGFIKLIKKGVFASAVINNRRYWPSMVPGKEMEDHFEELVVGEIYSI